MALSKPLRIGLCTSALEVNIASLLSTLISILSMIDVQMVPLPYNDLDSYPVELQGLDGLILCHSINNRRFAITDVMDALYDRFLSRAKKYFGKDNVVVIAHDFAWPFRHGLKSSTMDSFRRNQPTAVNCSSLVIICGKLDTAVEMDGDDWNKLLAFAKAVQPLKTVSIPMSIVDTVSVWGQSAVSLVVCVTVFIVFAIVLIVGSVSLIPLMIIVLPVVLVSYWFWNKKRIPIKK